MDLEEFVATTIRDIVQGVVKAQSEVAHTGAKVNSELGRVNVVDPIRDGQTQTRIQEIDFDVAVTVTDSNKGGAGAKFGLSVISVGVDASNRSEHQSASRIRFRIPLVLPR